MRLVFELIAGTSAPAQARTLANGLAADVHPETLADLRIVISELVANAVKYGPGSPIHVELDVRAPHDVRGEVVDRGDTSAATTAPRIVERRSPRRLRPAPRRPSDRALGRLQRQHARLVALGG